MDITPIYNTLVGVAAGIGLIAIAQLIRRLQRATAADETWTEDFAAEGWALVLGPAGLILTVLGFAITITWPYRVPAILDANILFGEPAVAFGVLLLAASFYLWKERHGLDIARVWAVLRPVSLYIFALGLVMGACAISWVRYQLGAAPPSEPISGRLSAYPWIEATFLFILYGLVALGALLFPLVSAATRVPSLAAGSRASVAAIVYWAWLIAGVIWLLFSAMNFYTHIGSLQNAYMGTNYQW
jgi:uncharacterized membrane protein